MIFLHSRLSTAAELIGSAHTVADIGCDHGRLAAALLQRGAAERVIASDISEQSLQKARSLAIRCGVSIEFRVADGLAALSPGEAEVIVIAGMGGELIASMLSDGEAVARSARSIVMQPMRGTAELREYLYTHGYTVTDERIVLDAGRYYQLIAASNGVSAGWPTDIPSCGYEFGALMIQNRDPLLVPMLEKHLCSCKRKLESAARKGRNPKALTMRIDMLRAIISYTEEAENEA